MRWDISSKLIISRPDLADPANFNTWDLRESKTKYSHLILPSSGVSQSVSQSGCLPWSVVGASLGLSGWTVPPEMLRPVRAALPALKLRKIDKDLPVQDIVHTGPRTGWLMERAAPQRFDCITYVDVKRSVLNCSSDILISVPGLLVRSHVICLTAHTLSRMARMDILLHYLECLNSHITVDSPNMVIIHASQMFYSSSSILQSKQNIELSKHGTDLR